jgi:D-alanyl-D-alanine dipeptidase
MQRLTRRKTFIIYDTVAKAKKEVNKDTSYLDLLFRIHGLTSIHDLDSSIRIDLRYADTNNFLRRNFYDGLRKAYFPCEVALKICNAQALLKMYDPDYSLLILDATRPLHIQQMMWDSLDLPPGQKYNYLAPPYTISLHNYGCAVDVTIVDTRTNKELEMGSDFDHFGKLSEPVYEWKFLKSGELSGEALENRKLLRKVMQSAKLNPITSEWWHFNYCTKEFAAANFTLIK